MFPRALASLVSFLSPGLSCPQPPPSPIPKNLDLSRHGGHITTVCTSRCTLPTPQCQRPLPAQGKLGHAKQGYFCLEAGAPWACSRPVSGTAGAADHCHQNTFSGQGQTGQPEQLSPPRSEDSASSRGHICCEDTPSVNPLAQEI